jgi:hypothetical protein
MPFYLRTKPRRPVWQPAAWSAAAILIWGLSQTLLHRSQSPSPQLGGLGQTLYLVGLTLVAAALAGAVYWALALPLLRSSLALRLLLGTVAAAVFLTALTLAAGLTSPSGPWTRVARSEFTLSTALLSLVLGWLIARDPLGLAVETERVYLNPKDVAQLSESERARLTLEGGQPAEGGEAAAPDTKGAQAGKNKSSA